jgi:hypothetical protein
MNYVIEGPVEFSYLKHMGRLWLMAMVEAPMDMPRGPKCPLIGADVTIQKMTFRCTGVEAQQPGRPIAKGEKLGLKLCEAKVANRRNPRVRAWLNA